MILFLIKWFFLFIYKNYNYKIKTRNMHISEVFLSKFNFLQTFYIHTYVHTYIPQVFNRL